MFYLTSLLAFAAFVAAQGTEPTIATPPSVVQCQPAQISFVATNTPVFISIIPGGQPTAAPLQDLGQQNASPFTWVANIRAGTSITLQIRDSRGAVAYSAPFEVQNGSDSSCLGAGASGSASATGSASSASATSVQSSASSVQASVSSSSAAAETSSVVQVTSSIAASVSSAVSSATAPPSSSRAPSSAASSTRSATATSAATSPSTTPNSARSNMQVGFAGLLGLAAAAVMA